MAFNHVLLELWCLKGIDKHADQPLPAFCAAVEEPNYGCLANKCPFVDFTTCEHTLCYINGKSEMEYGILFDYETYPDEVERWREMCVEAVERTYEEFMKDTKE